MTEVKDIDESVNVQFLAELKETKLCETDAEKLLQLLTEDKTPKPATILDFYKQCPSEGASE